MSLTKEQIQLVAEQYVSEKQLACDNLLTEMEMKLMLYAHKAGQRSVKCIIDQELHAAADRAMEAYKASGMTNLADRARRAALEGVGDRQTQYQWVPWGHPSITNKTLTDTSVLKFDTGEVCLFGDKDWPIAIVIEVFLVPEPPKQESEAEHG